MKFLKRMWKRRRAVNTNALAFAEVVRPFFDEDHYMSQPGAPPRGVDPLQHFMQAGWKRRLDPNLSFSTDGYLQANPDIVAAGVNPFLHFLQHGYREGRSGAADGQIALDDLGDAEIYASWRKAWRSWRHMSAQLRAAPERFALFTIVLLPGDDTAANASLASLAAQDYANIEIIRLAPQLSDEAVPDFSMFRGLFVDESRTLEDYLARSSSHDEWRGDFVFFMECGAWLEEDFFSQVNAGLWTADGRSADAPALVTLDYDAICSDGALRAPQFFHGWDPDFQLATGALTTNVMFRRDVLIEIFGLATARSADDILQALAMRKDNMSAAHLAGPLLHLPEERHSSGTRAPVALPPRGDASERLLSIVIPNRDRPELLESCCRFLDAPGDIRIELIIVDNASTDLATLALYDRLRAKHGARIVAMNQPFNYARMINVGVAASSGDMLLFLNNDVIIPDRACLSALCATALRPEVGLAGSVLLYPDGTIQHAGMLLLPNAGGGPAFAGHAYRHAPTAGGVLPDALNAPRNWQAVTGALQCCRRSVFDEAGGYDELCLPVEYNDVDFCLRVRRLGYRILCLPLAGVVHDESATRKLQDELSASASRRLAVSHMHKRWPEAFAHDPYRNPFLNIMDRWPPQVRDFRSRRLREEGRP